MDIKKNVLQSAYLASLIFTSLQFKAGSVRVSTAALALPFSSFRQERPPERTGRLSEILSATYRHR